MSSLTSVSCDAAPYEISKWSVGAQEIPDECAFSIFGFLPPEDLARSSCVSRQWKRLADNPVLWKLFDLQAIFREKGCVLNIIDRKVWATHVDLDAAGLHVDDISFSSRAIFPVLMQMFASLEIEGNAGITLLTLPPVTLRKLQTVFPTSFEDLDPLLLERHGDIAMTETRLVAMTNNILKRSRGLSFVAHKELVQGKGCEMPGITAVVALAILTEKQSSAVPPVRLFRDSSWTYTRCAEDLGNDWSVVVGDFSLSGLRVSRHFGGDMSDGVGCLRAF